ncbi:hypothetical protein V6N12_018583 [Hibiscus sabdariffa]|uniref:RNase H type-1 domain-containing protein n=1 Tax=Hibiscus sabdariffa TaxID=183260 RepID=A0ABR2BY96_9ROSI
MFENIENMPPQIGIIKINTDGAFHASTNTTGIGVIAHGNNCQVLGGLAQHSIQGLDALHVEFLVVLADIHLARDKGWHRVVFETDSAIVINKFNRSRPNLSMLGPLIAHGKLLLDVFDEYRFSFYPRSNNLVAHTLASCARNSMFTFTFESVCPILFNQL